MSNGFVISGLTLTLLLGYFSPAQPVSADSLWTQDTKVDFDAGALTNVDTSYSPNDVVLASKLYTGNGAAGALTVTRTYYTDDVRSEIHWRPGGRNYAGSIEILVASTGGIAAGQEVIIIQMAGEVESYSAASTR